MKLRPIVGIVSVAFATSIVIFFSVNELPDDSLGELSPVLKHHARLADAILVGRGVIEEQVGSPISASNSFSHHDYLVEEESRFDLPDHTGFAIRKRLYSHKRTQEAYIVDELVSTEESHASAVVLSARVANEIIAVFPDFKSREQLDSLAAKIGWKLKKKEGSTHRFILETDQISLEALPSALAKIDSLKLSDQGMLFSPNYLVFATTVPNDLYYSEQSFYLQTSEVEASINATLGWPIRSSAKEVVVAVIDSGITTEHEDLGNNLWKNANEIPEDGQDNDQNGFVDDWFGASFIERNGNVADDSGHGTFVSGIIGAAGNNGKGITGIAWEVQLMPLKILNGDGFGTLDAAADAIDYAVKHGAHVINASWGSYDPIDAVLGEVIETAEKAGVLVVAAAGNESLDIDDTPIYPASLPNPNILTVGSIFARQHGPSSFSNWGRKSVDVLAPGTGIVSLGHDSVDSYVVAEGTSASAPIVTGILALLIAEYPDSDYKSQRARLLHTGLPIQSSSRPTRFDRIPQLNLALSATQPPFVPEFEPGNQTSYFQILEGETLALGAAAESPDGVEYRWETGSGHPIEGQRTERLVIENAEKSDEGIYRLFAFNQHGESFQTFSLNVLEPHPATSLAVGKSEEIEFFGTSLSVTDDSESWNAASVRIRREQGERAFIARFEGPGTLRFYWRTSGVVSLATKAFLNGEELNLTPSNSWSPVTIDIPESGLQKLRIVVPSSDDPDSQNLEYLLLDEFKLFELGKPAPLILEQATGGAFDEGTTIELSVIVAEEENLSYQWFYNGVPLEGENTSVLRLESVSLSEVGEYHLEIVGLHGKTESSRVPIYLEGNAAMIVESPEREIEAAIGGDVLIKYSFSGDGPFDFQWYYGEHVIPGQTQPELTIPNLEPFDFGSYRLRYQNAGMVEPEFTETTTLSLADRSAPDFGHKAETLFANRGDPFLFRNLKTFTGEEIQFQWYRNGQKLIGQNNQWISIESISLSDGGDYSLAVSNEYGSKRKLVFSLTVIDASKEEVIGVDQGSEQLTWIAFEGTKIVEGELTDKNSLRIQGDNSWAAFTIEGPVVFSYWIRSFQPLDFFHRLKVGDAYINVPPASEVWTQVACLVPEGEHRISLSTTALQSSSEFSLADFRFSTKPLVVESPFSTSYSERFPARLRAIAFSTGSPTYQWLRNGEVVENVSEPEITISREEDAGSYQLQISNDHGSSLSDPANLSYDAELGSSFAKELNRVAFGGGTNWIWAPEPETDGLAVATAGRVVQDQGLPWIDLEIEGPKLASVSIKRKTESLSILENGQAIGVKTFPKSTWTDYTLNVPSGIHSYRFMGDDFAISRVSFEETIGITPGHARTSELARGRPASVEFWLEGLYPPFTYTWKKNGEIITPPGFEKQGNYAILNFDEFSEEDVGEYQCIVVDAQENRRESPTVSLSLVEDPSDAVGLAPGSLSFFEIFPWHATDEEASDGGYSIKAGVTPDQAGNRELWFNKSGYQTVRFDVMLKDTSRGDRLKLRWGAPYPEELTATPEERETDWIEFVHQADPAHGLTLLLEPNQYSNAEIFLDNARLSNEPVIDVQPANVVTVLGSAIELSVEARSQYPISYQWYKDGAPLESETESSLRLPRVTIDNIGEYFVRLSSLGDSVESDTATISLASGNSFIDVLDTLTVPLTLKSHDAWSIDHSRSASGESSLRSHELAVNEFAEFSINVIGPCFVGFYSSVIDSETEKNPIGKYDFVVQGGELQNILSIGNWSYHSYFVGGHEARELSVRVKHRANSELLDPTRIVFRIDSLEVRELRGLTFEEWVTQFSHQAGNNNVFNRIRQKTADPDTDNLSNAIEYLFGLDPLSADHQPTFHLQINNDEPFAVLQPTVRNLASIQLSFEQSRDLIRWDRIQPQSLGVETRDQSQFVRHGMPISMTDNRPVFFRWRIDERERSSIQNATLSPQGQSFKSIKSEE